MRLKRLVKWIGRCFIRLREEDVPACGSALIIDNGYCHAGQLMSCVESIRMCVPGVFVTVLTSQTRAEVLETGCNGLKFAYTMEGFRPKRYCIARNMLARRNDRHDTIVLLSLDVTPIIASIFFMKGRVFLFNQWSQWWSLRPGFLKVCLTAIPKTTISSVIFLYLLLSVSLIFIKRWFNALRLGLRRIA